MPRKHFLQAIFAASILLVEFLLCRFILFDWHGMKDFPLLLFLFGMGVIFLSLPSVSHSIRFSVPIGYAVGFFSGILFHFLMERTPAVEEQTIYGLFGVRYISSVF